MTDENLSDLRTASERLWRTTRHTAWRRFPSAPLAPVFSDYSRGDDLCHVDWAYCARHDELLTRRDLYAPPCDLWLMVDCSAGMALGSPAKLSFARRLAAAMGFTALANRSRVGAVAFAGGMIEHLPPRQDMRSFDELAEFLAGIETTRRDAPLIEAASFLAGERQSGAVVAILSDFFHDDGFEAACAMLQSAGHRPMLVQTFSREEARPPAHGWTSINDVNRRRRRSAQLSDEVVERYHQAFVDWQTSIVRYCTWHRLAYAPLATDLSLHDAARRLVAGVSLHQRPASPPSWHARRPGGRW